MKKSQFEARLKRAVAWDQEPALSQDEIDDLVDLARTRDSRNFSPEDVSEWEAATHYNLGQMVVNPNRQTFICVADGESGAIAPTFVRGGSIEIEDGSVQWVYQGQTNWTPTYDLNRAAYEAWGIKAARAASDYAFSSDGARFERNQVLEHCERMQRKFALTSSARMRSRDFTLLPIIVEVKVND